MSEITLKINNRGYCLYCDEGQEQRLGDLAEYVDSRLKDISAAGAATNEAHLLVLTSLVMADEVFELKDQMAELKAKMAQLQEKEQNAQQSAGSMNPQEEEMIANAIEHMANRINKISRRFEMSDAA